MKKNNDTKCKYCNKKGICSFGFLDRHGIWHNKELVCWDHRDIAMGQQRHLASMENLQWRMEQFGKNLPIVFSTGC